MRIAVRLFAAGRELAGASEVVVDAESVGQLRRRLASEWPALAPLAARSLVAVNAEYADDATPLAAGDQVALVPPVSGG